MPLYIQPQPSVEVARDCQAKSGWPNTVELFTLVSFFWLYFAILLH